MIESLYQMMRIGIVHFKAYPGIERGEGPILETLEKICADDFWTAVEVGWMRDYRILNSARHLLDQPFIVISGDALTDFDLTDLVDYHRRKGALVTIALKRVANPLEFGVVVLERFQLAHQGVELGVGDLWIVEDVVSFLVVTDRRPQILDSSGWGGHLHLACACAGAGQIHADKNPACARGGGL